MKLDRKDLVYLLCILFIGVTSITYCKVVTGELDDLKEYLLQHPDVPFSVKEGIKRK